MSLMNWSDKFTIVPSIDSQHKKLIDLLNQLHDAMLKHAANDALAHIFDELVKYTGTHFAYEEKLFSEHKYQHESVHKQEHKNLVKKALELQAQFKSGQVTVSVNTLNFLREWLNNHILKTDMAYKEFFISKGIK